MCFNHLKSNFIPVRFSPVIDYELYSFHLNRYHYDNNEQKTLKSIKLEYLNPIHFSMNILLHIFECKA